MILRVAAFFFILDPRTGLFYLLFIYCYSSYASACPGYILYGTGNTGTADSFFWVD